jgi:hypothetical protein
MKRRTRTLGGRKWLHPLLLIALVEAGGQQSNRWVTSWVLSKIQSQLIPEDHERVKTGETRIENQIAWARKDLVDDGRMDRGTSIGTWSISGCGRTWLSNNPWTPRRIVHDPDEEF